MLYVVPCCLSHLLPLPHNTVYLVGIVGVNCQTVVWMVGVVVHHLMASSTCLEWRRSVAKCGFLRWQVQQYPWAMNHMLMLFIEP